MTEIGEVLGLRAGWRWGENFNELGLGSLKIVGNKDLPVTRKQRSQLSIFDRTQIYSTEGND
jgi:hypothetical protein